MSPEPESSPFLSIVIPVYGSERVLPELVARIENVIDTLPLARGNSELIFVCDCSPDQSWEVIKSLATARPWVRGVLLRVNAGQHNAVMAGLAQARGSVVITMDDDLQHSPSDIPALLDELMRGRDVVFARFTSRQHAAWKVLGSRLSGKMAEYLLKKPPGLYLSPFRAIRASILDDLLRYQGPYVYVDGLILTVTRNIGAVDVAHHERYLGDGGYSLRKSISLWLKMATSFSIFPLRLTSLAGMLMAGVGFVAAILLVVARLNNNALPSGWASLIVAFLIIGGMQLLAIGMVGEYLGRALLTLNERPQYVIGETVGLPTPRGAPKHHTASRRV